MDLAELKLYLREEHLRAKSVKTRLKRVFGSVPGDQSSSGAVDAVPTAADTVVDSESAPTTGPSGSQNSTSTSTDLDDVTSSTQPSIRGIIESFDEVTEMDNNEPAPTPSPESLSIPIKDLFDFTQPYWIEAYEKLAMRGLQDELELYELLDLDAEGDTVENEADDALNE